MAQRAQPGAVDAHNQPAGRVRADGATVGLHPVGGVIESLLGRQQRNDGLKRIETEISAGGQGEFAAAEMEAIADRHGAGAIAFNGLNDNGQVIKLKLIGVHGIVRS